ncbi:MAG: cation-translocating P-type ATPase [Eubacteriales bacterium]|nr:cation-translocating P-type ATPase [Eubacteriales bacterium]
MFENRTLSETLETLATTPAGLTGAEAAARLARDGENVLTEKKPPTRLQMFLHQLNEPMIYILLAAAVISLFLKEVSDAVIILCVVLLNAVVGVEQEGKAQKALEALKKLSSPVAVVRRAGQVLEVPAARLVQGDVVLLEAGRIIPADLRLIQSASLKIEESALTGESVPVEKDAAFVTAGEVPLGDRINMAYMSTAVSYGRGEGVVVSTAEQTEIGKIAALIAAGKEEPTPLQKRLADLGKLLGILTIVICVALFGIALIQRRDVVEMLITAISLAVAAVPEGLPAVVTIVLAIGVQRMAKAHSIVRRLPAVETLGAVSVVCSDKTGTLTQNKMTVTKAYANGQLVDVSQLNPQRDALLLNGFVLCCDASVDNNQRIGDPTELALLDMGVAHGIRRTALEGECPRINEQAFDSDRKLMTTVHRTAGAPVAFTKGAVDRLLRRCTQIVENGQTRPLSDADHAAILDASTQMAALALRVLALAVKYGDDSAAEEDLTFVGLVGMIDPPRPEAAAAVQSFKDSGILTIMITGDHRDTAYAIARELGIAHSPDQCISGDELDSLSQQELNQRVMDIRVFARVSPSHKVMIVKAFKANGKIVSMTGDGVNDAPSLKAADIGVAMGIAGTDVAKSAADMVLTDDNFATIEKAVEEGRGIYANIKKTVVFLLSSNLGEVVSMFAAITAGLAAPLQAVHILWVNLITDSLPALALGSDDKPRGIMKQRPRDPDASLFADGGWFFTGFYGLLIAVLTLGAFLYLPVRQLLGAGQGVTLAGLAQLLRGDLLVSAQTYAFTTLAISQLFHAIGMRDVDRSIFRRGIFNNRMMLFAFVFGLTLQVLVTEVPALAGVFGTSRLHISEWLYLGLWSMVPLLFHEIIVVVRRLRK